MSAETPIYNKPRWSFTFDWPIESRVNWTRWFAHGKSSIGYFGPTRDGWMRPMDCGAYDGSYHSATLASLCKRGLAESRRRVCSIMGLLGSPRVGKVYRLKISFDEAKKLIESP